MYIYVYIYIYMCIYVCMFSCVLRTLWIVLRYLVLATARSDATMHRTIVRFNHFPHD